MIDKVSLAQRTFSEIAKALQGLTDAQFRSLAAGRARIELHFDDEVVTRPIKKASGGAKRASTGSSTQALSVEDAVKAIRGFATSDQIRDYIETNKRALTVPKLTEVARMLGPTVSVPSKPTRPTIVAAIVTGTAGYREDSEVMLPGGFR